MSANHDLSWFRMQDERDEARNFTRWLWAACRELRRQRNTALELKWREVLDLMLYWIEDLKRRELEEHTFQSDYGCGWVSGIAFCLDALKKTEIYQHDKAWFEADTIADARTAALEEAARVCDDIASVLPGDDCFATIHNLSEVARLIRALMSSDDESDVTHES